ncbi:hypothetical protein AURDEDRAFT_125285 [Auricularia subglabra TFB-10046 SS5]|nr:hypothetical protein AURDEDRAFT_125285 [Auricularia subglabra TFB-10046 SS5]
MYSSPSIVGPMMAVGNVGEKLAPYVDSDPFLSRDGDFAWEKSPTDRVNYFLNEGMKRNERVFVTNDKMRVESIVTVTGDASRKFVLFGHYAHTPNHDVAYTWTSRICLSHLSLSASPPI